MLPPPPPSIPCNQVNSQGWLLPNHRDAVNWKCTHKGLNYKSQHTAKSVSQRSSGVRHSLYHHHHHSHPMHSQPYTKKPKKQELNLNLNSYLNLRPKKQKKKTRNSYVIKMKSPFYD